MIYSPLPPISTLTPSKAKRQTHLTSNSKTPSSTAQIPQDRFSASSVRFSGLFSAKPNSSTQALWKEIDNQYNSPVQLHQEVVEYLKAGADPKVRDEKGQNALHKLAKADFLSPAMRRRLTGGDPNFEQFRMGNGDLIALPQTFKLLENAGCDWEEPDHDGHTPLHLLRTNITGIEPNFLPALENRLATLNKFREDLANQNVRGVAGFLLKSDLKLSDADPIRADLPTRLFEIPENVAFIERYCPDSEAFRKKVCEQELIDDLDELADTFNLTPDDPESKDTHEAIAQRQIARLIPPSQPDLSVTARITAWLGGVLPG